MDSCTRETINLAFLKVLQKMRRVDGSEIYRDLPRSEAITLFTVAHLMRENNNSQISVTDVVNRMGVSPQTLSRSLKSLEQKGIIDRQSHKDDRRSTLIVITERGEKLIAEIKEGIDNFCSIVVQRMGQDEMKEFIRLSEKCSSIIEETASELVNSVYFNEEE